MTKEEAVKDTWKERALRQSGVSMIQKFSPKDAHWCVEMATRDGQFVDPEKASEMGYKLAISRMEAKERERMRALNEAIHGDPA